MSAEDMMKLEHLYELLRNSDSRDIRFGSRDWAVHALDDRLKLTLNDIDYARAHELARELRPTSIVVDTRDETIRHEPFVGAEPDTLEIVDNPIIPIPKNTFLTKFEASSCTPPIDVVDQCESIRSVRFDDCRVADELVMRLAARVDLTLCRCPVSAELVVAAFRTALANQRRFVAETDGIDIGDVIPIIASDVRRLHVVPNEYFGQRKLAFEPDRVARIQLTMADSVFERDDATISWPALDTLYAHYLPRALGLVAPNLRTLHLDARGSERFDSVDFVHDDFALPQSLRRVIIGDFRDALRIHNTPPFPDVERDVDYVGSLELRNHPARAVLALFSAAPSDSPGRFVERGVDLGRLLFSILLNHTPTRDP
jgi:hypothetical protein